MFGPKIILDPRCSILLVGGVIKCTFGSACERIIAVLPHLILFITSIIITALEQTMVRSKGDTYILCFVMQRAIVNYFIEQQNMTYFPSQLHQPQLLWQPVIVQQLKDQTIEHLKRENDFLKQQLSQVLKINQRNVNFQHQQYPISQPSDRYSLFPKNQCCSTRRQSKNGCYSPRLQTNRNRLSSNRSPGIRNYLSPKEFIQNKVATESTQDESARFKRMVISKDKDGKYYRDIFKEIQQSENHLTPKTINKFSTTQNSTIFSVTPTVRSKENNEMFASSFHQRVTSIRLKSPSFFKNINHKNEKPENGKTLFSDNLHKQPMMCQSRPCFKRSHRVQQSIVESDQTKEQIIQQPNVVDKQPELEQLKESKVQRHQSRVPTLQLSYECDSNLSIEMMLRQFKRQKKKKQTKFSICDHFLKDIEQNLDAMYGKH